MKLRNSNVQYEKDGLILSSYQRGEIVELDTDTQKIIVVAHYKNYGIAEEATRAFNKLEAEKVKFIEKQKQDLRDYEKSQEKAFRDILETENHCRCSNCEKS